MAISADYLQKLVEDYAKSKAGKAAIKKQHGIDYSPKADPRIQGAACAKRMREILYKHIQSLKNERGEKSLGSVQLNDIVIGNIKPTGDGNYCVTLSLQNVDRKSLIEDKYPEGVYDIVGLFYRGYSYPQSKRVYGEWRGERIGSRISRDSNDFVKNAVEEFNKEMKARANAELVGEYAD